jgi:hypothetical protein
VVELRGHRVPPRAQDCAYLTYSHASLF